MGGRAIARARTGRHPRAYLGMIYHVLSGIYFPVESDTRSAKCFN